MDHLEYQRRRQSRGVCGSRPAAMGRQFIDSAQQRRQPLAALDPNSSRVHPGLGPLVSLAEAQARADIRMRGFLPAQNLPSQQSTPSSKTVSDAFPVAMPKRKPIPSFESNRVGSVEVGGQGQSRQLKRRPVPSVHTSNNRGRAPRKDISTIDPDSEPQSSQQQQLPRRPVQVLIAPFQTPRKIWKKLEVESQGAIKAWPNTNEGSPSPSPGKVWRRLEAETNDVIEAWLGDVNTRRQP